MLVKSACMGRAGCKASRLRPCQALGVPTPLVLPCAVQVCTACANSFAHGSNEVANSVGPLAAIYQVGTTLLLHALLSWAQGSGSMCLLAPAPLSAGAGCTSALLLSGKSARLHTSACPSSD